MLVSAGLMMSGGRPSADAAPPNTPANTVAPAITGTATVGQTLTVSNGTWTNSPTGYARQWTRDGADIAGATGATYTLVAGDSGKMIGARVTATNADGSGAAIAAAVGPVTAVVGKPYEDFVAWVETQGATANPLPNYQVGWAVTLAKMTLGASFVGDMYGSPWNASPSSNYVGSDAALSRVAQHLFEDATAANANLGRVVLIQVEDGGQTTVSGMNRNGYLSLNGVEVVDTYRAVRFDYYDGRTGQRVRVSNGGFVQKFDL